MTRATLVAMLALALMGCDPDAPGPLSARPPQPLLDFERSGGYTGTTQTLRISTDGSAALESTEVGPTRFEISNRRVAELTETLEEIDWTRAANEPANVSCADCYFYDISYEDHRVTTSGLGNSGRELEDLFALVDAALAER